MTVVEEATRKTRIQQKREKQILDCALSAFATYGFHGTTIDEIARQADLSKPNLLYYFKNKEVMYQAILERTMEGWLDPFLAISAEGDPLEELTKYVSAKIDMSFDNPLASRLFAIEVQSGAAQLKQVMQQQLKTIVDDKARIIQRWMDQGSLKRIDPHHLIFSIWSVTQHYADFAVQIETLLGKPCDRETAREAAIAVLIGAVRVSSPLS